MSTSTEIDRVIKGFYCICLTCRVGKLNKLFGIGIYITYNHVKLGLSYICCLFVGPNVEKVKLALPYPESCACGLRISVCDDVISVCTTPANGSPVGNVSSGGAGGGGGGGRP